MAKFGTFKFGTGIKFGTGYLFDTPQGRIIYTPLPTRGILLDGSHYLSIDNADFNFGVSDFGADVLLEIDPTVVDPIGCILHKQPSVLTGASGWGFYYVPGNKSLYFTINDGNALPLVLTTENSVIPALGVPFWAGFRAARSGQVRIYVNGVDVGGGDISSRKASVNNSALLTLGALDGGESRHKGRIDFVRIDKDRILSASWHDEEWDRIRYGCPRQIQDFTAFWTFYGDSLAELSANSYTLIWQGGGSPAYVDGWPTIDAPIIYTFEENFTFDIEPGRLDLDDNQRMSNGSAFHYPHPNQKTTFVLPFQYILPTQQAAFEAAWAAKQPIDLYLRGDRPKENGQFQIMKYPLVKYVFSNRMDAELDLEQV